MNDPDFPRGVKLLHDPVRNKGTAFTEAERDALGLRGLLPPRVCSAAEQELRVLENLRNKSTDLERHQLLISLQDRNETLFYRVVMNHIEQLMPLIYIPTVGHACQQYGHIYRRPRGVYISMQERGRIRDILDNWPHKEVKVIVVTDGERILGLGDLGAAGMGVPIGKLSLYTACAGVPPTQCLPVMLDVGTDNEMLLNDPLYLGAERLRERGDAYDDFIEEFIAAVGEVFPQALIQLEDFGNNNAFRLLERYRATTRLFDDDIQGTGAVILGGLQAALRIAGGDLAQQRILLHGAGQAGIGIANTIVAALVAEGLTEEDARQRCWFFDSDGLLVAHRSGVPAHKQPYAHQHPEIDDLVEALRTLKSTVLIGCSGQAGAFDEAVLRTMAGQNERPVILALSNPCEETDCTAQAAYEFTEGRGVFASASHHEPVVLDEERYLPAQCHNAYVFPGLGMGVLASDASRITDSMFVAAARVLAAQVGEEELAQGCIYPPMSAIREVSTAIATEVASIAYREGIAGREEPADIEADIRDQMFIPLYPHYA